MAHAPEPASRLGCLAERQLVLESLLTLYRRLVSVGRSASLSALESAERCLAASYAHLREVEARLSAVGGAAQGGASPSESLFEAEARKLRVEIVEQHRALEAAVAAERDEVAGVLRRLRDARRIANGYRLPGIEPGSIVDTSR